MKKKLVVLTALLTLSTRASRARRRAQEVRSALFRELITKYGGLDCVPADPESLGISDTLSSRDRKTVMKEHQKIVQQNMAENLIEEPSSNHDSMKEGN